MGREYRAKVFQSGNSAALRLPKALGMKIGSEVILREDDAGDVVLSRIPEGQPKIDLTGIAGAMPGLAPLSREDRLFEDSPRDWSALAIPDRKDKP